MKVNSDYSAVLLQRINSVVLGGVSISSFFSLTIEGKTHSLWASQQNLLVADIRKFSESKDFDTFIESQTKRNLLSYLVDPILHVVAFFVSLLSMLKLFIFRNKVLVYSVDKLREGTKFEHRLFEIYRILNTNKISYVEIVHTLLGKKFLKNLFKRGRVVFYLESLQILLPFFKDRKSEKRYLDAVQNLSLEQFTESERPFVKYLLKKYVKSCLISKFRIRMFKLLLKKSNIRVLFTIDDFRHSNELVFACKLSGIKTYMFQHGDFDYTHNIHTIMPSLYVFPSILFVWSKYWCKQLPKMNPLFAFHKDRLKVSGRATGQKFDTLLPAGPLRRGEDVLPTVLVPYEATAGDKSIHKEHINKFVECGAKVIFKPRPDMPQRNQIKEYGLEEKVKEGVVKVQTTITDEDFSSIDVVVGTYSSYLGEMVEQGKPVAILDTLYVSLRDISAEGLAENIGRTEKDMCKRLHEIATISKETILERRSCLTEGTGNIEEIVTSILHEHM